MAGCVTCARSSLSVWVAGECCSHRLMYILTYVYTMYIYATVARYASIFVDNGLMMRSVMVDLNCAAVENLIASTT